MRSMASRPRCVILVFFLLLTLASAIRCGSGPEEKLVCRMWKNEYRRKCSDSSTGLICRVLHDRLQTNGCVPTTTTPATTTTTTTTPAATTTIPAATTTTTPDTQCPVSDAEVTCQVEADCLRNGGALIPGLVCIVGGEVCCRQIGP